jgi:formate dehydrogenase beta subunit
VSKASRSQLPVEARVNSLKALLAEGFDAVFVGAGAPRGRDLPLPGRIEARSNIHIGVEWLTNIWFKYIDRIGERVVVIGGGNTAMDCARNARRLGGSDVKVVVRSSLTEMKATEWEKDDLLREGITITNDLVPKDFSHQNGRITGVWFEAVKSVYQNGRRTFVPTGAPLRHFPCDDVLIAAGQEPAFPWIERDLGIEFDTRDVPKVDPKTLRSTHPKVFFGGDAAFGPKNIITAVAHGHEAGISIDRFLRGENIDERPSPTTRLITQTMPAVVRHIPEVSTDSRFVVPLRPQAEALADIHAEVELGFDLARAVAEAGRCLHCEVETVFSPPLCVECKACESVCPTECITFTKDGEEVDLRNRLQRTRDESNPGSLRRRRPRQRSRHGQERGRLPALRPVRTKLPHRGVADANLPPGNGACWRAQRCRNLRSNNRWLDLLSRWCSPAAADPAP